MIPTRKGHTTLLLKRKHCESWSVRLNWKDRKAMQDDGLAMFLDYPGI